jgi:hypothetical protein
VEQRVAIEAQATAGGQAWAASQPELDIRQLVIIRPPGSVTSGLLQRLAHLPAYGDLLLTLTVHRVKVRYKKFFWIEDLIRLVEETASGR